MPYSTSALSDSSSPKPERPGKPHQSLSPIPPPIVYTIAGSDSGGGAGIQADLHTIQAMGCHGCSAITCLTAQNSVGVTAVHVSPPEFLRNQIDAIQEDLPPRAIKVGMLANKALAEEIGRYLEKVKSKASRESEPPFVVVDPVMISTSGHRLIDEETQKCMIKSVFPYADILTPNKYEAEVLLQRQLSTLEDVEAGARDILELGVKSVLIKGGHSLTEGGEGLPLPPDANATSGYAQDYFLSSNDVTDRLCDGGRGVWLRTQRYDTEHTHGTGCTLSSAIASALAIGHQHRELSSLGTGASRAIVLVDACCIAKAYVTAGIGRSVQLGKGPGPVAHTFFPSSYRHFPSVAFSPKVPSSAVAPFMAVNSSTENRTGSLGKILPIVDSREWVERLANVKGVTDIQLRLKVEKDVGKITSCVKACQEVCTSHGVRLWVNDHWEAAINAGCFGVHLGQEDVASCVDSGGIDKLRECNLALGISTHSFAELSAALGLKPSYISLGPVFGTSSKSVAFDPQGLETVSKWRELIPPHVPLVAIGGIGDAESAKAVKEAGAECAAVIGAITGTENIKTTIRELLCAMD